MVFIFYKQPHLHLPYTVVANAIKLVGINHMCHVIYERPSQTSPHFLHVASNHVIPYLQVALFAIVNIIHDLFVG
jgi:hypothetical protein